MPTLVPTPTKKKSPKIRPDDGSGSILGWDSQVVLFNDDVNTFEHVIDCLMAIFGHGRQLAEKITLEAHTRGRAIAEVEPREKAENPAPPESWCAWRGSNPQPSAPEADALSN